MQPLLTHDEITYLATWFRQPVETLLELYETGDKAKSSFDQDAITGLRGRIETTLKTIENVREDITYAGTKGPALAAQINADFAAYEIGTLPDEIEKYRSALGAVTETTA